MMTHVPQKTVPFTYREYALLPDDGRRHELIEGEFYVTPAPAPIHQRVSRRLQRVLMTQLEDTGLAEVFDAPIDVLLHDMTCLQPDLAIVRTDRRHLITRRAIEGPPDLVVEILSPSSKGQDQFLKRGTCAKFEIPEYWIVDPEHGSITVLRAEKGETVYTLTARFDRASTLRSVEFPQIEIALAPIFKDVE